MSSKIMQVLEQHKCNYTEQVKGLKIKLNSLIDTYSKITSKEPDYEDLAKQVDLQLRTDKRIVNLDVKDDKLIVKTNVLYCLDPRDGVNHELGSYTIYIPLMDFRQDNIRWHNETRVVNGYQAPHVFADGHACLGNASAMYQEAYHNCDVVAIVKLSLGFLEQVNTDDSAGARISDWPKAGKNAPVIKVMSKKGTTPEPVKKDPDDEQ